MFISFFIISELFASDDCKTELDSIKNDVFRMGICEYKYETDYRKLECDIETGLPKLTSSFTSTCLPSFAGDVLYLRNGVCTPYRLGSSVYGLRATWSVDQGIYTL